MASPAWIEYLAAAKTTLDIFRGIQSELPKGAKAEHAQKEIEKAEQSLRASEAELAKALGYRLCRCEFPPHIMLWNKDVQASICPKCGDRYPPLVDVRSVPDEEDDWIKVRR
jgi:hypothetical protein